MIRNPNASKKHKCQNRPTVQRLRQLETYRQIKAESVLAESIEDAPVFSAIRDGQLVNVAWKDLRPDEIRAAYNNAFHTYEGA